VNGTRTQSTQSTQDWMNMTASDWINMTPSDWMSRTSSQWNKSLSDLINTAPADWLATMRTSMGTPAAPQERHRHPGTHGHHGKPDCGCHEHHHRDCGCHRCGPDPCQCLCCIGDVDFAVYSRVGEQRVIPIIVENERRREAQVTAELSGWTTRGGKAAPIETVGFEPKTFTLPACGSQKITLVVKVVGAGAGDATNENRAADVDDCLVATADLRLTGCDCRPLRIAVAILPRDCDPFEVSCGCTCC